MKRLQSYNLTPKSQTEEISLTSQLQTSNEPLDDKKRASSLLPVTLHKKHTSIFVQSGKKDFQLPSLSQEKESNNINDANGFTRLVSKLPSKGIRFRNSTTLNDNNLPQISPKRAELTANYYKDMLIKAFNSNQLTYVLRIFREHFQQCVRALHTIKTLKIEPQKKINLVKSATKQKTVFLDLDETLVHCSQLLNHASVKLSIPLQNGCNVVAGVNIRPHCRQFLKELSNIAEIIIYTASNSNYADTILNYLDPDKKWISHRLYRQHCTLQKGYYIKDLRNINRNLQDVVIVDNSLYSYCMQLENGVPIIPYFDNSKDKELLSLLNYLKRILKDSDVRENNKKYFMFDKYHEGDIKNLLRDSV